MATQQQNGTASSQIINANNSSFSLFPNPQVTRPPPPVIRLHPNPRPKRSAEREQARQQQQQQLQQHHQQNLYTPPDHSTDVGTPSSSQDVTTPSRQKITHHTPLQFDPVPSSSVVASPQQQVSTMSGRSESATFSPAEPVARNGSVRSRSSIAKPPLDGGGGATSSLPLSSSSSSSRAAPAPLRSIFPTYNPDLPLDQQAYGPTQMSPSHIPRAVISRQSYYDPDAVSTTVGEEYTTEPLPELPAQQQQRSPPQRYQQQDTAAFTAASRGPARTNTLRPPPVIPQTSTTDQLKTFWKAANGWKAAPSEGRVFCLKLSQLKDAPVYTLSSASQPFYTLRLDPTSASALVSLSRHDPGKTYKLPRTESSTSTSTSASSPSMDAAAAGAGAGVGARSESKHWQQVLRTTLEEESRKHPPNDGLVALLMPDPATKMAVERADEPSLVAMAERECARLVWDEDSASNYLVHPALAAPFCVTVDRCPAWSRVEYTLEHHESPRHLAKLTRDGTGGGWLEVDTSVAAHIEAYYIIDVAVTALLLVAAADERSGGYGCASFAAGGGGVGMETFEPPPALAEPAATAARAGDARRGSGRFSRLSIIRREDNNNKKKKKKKQTPMEQFEMDLESQDGSLTKSSSTRVRTRSKRKKSKEKEDKLPFLVRAGIKVAKGTFKCIIWILTAVFRVLFRCVRSKY
ncbi:proline-rich protein [Beauveria bassiana ARSEF 2860]|uniref:Proline-rich protein n=1 Tax=Beauveria bassiana (strain ARSEF 2860) TaxID=655819 RepID=J4KNX0_BEAB2|nr:proline-rich protein [Beauveria bassiana ARSEF 2860]EJP66439.1 proline-rich protein [Beauveria bassiana ARSEF 2860]